MLRQTLFGILLLSVFIGRITAGNAIRPLTLSAQDGLSSSLTYNILKDQDGFLWISNRMGVDRYDGLLFKQYHLMQSPDDVLLLEDGKHHHLDCDRQGNLFCYTDRGKVFRYQRDIDQFQLLYNATSVLHRHSLHAAALSGDTLILGLYNGLYCIDLNSPDNQRHLCVAHNIRTLVPYTETTWLVGSNHGLGCLDLSRDTCYVLGLEQLDVKSIYYDVEQQRIWVGTNGSGLWTLRPDGTDVQQIEHWEKSIVTQIQPFGQDQLLVGTDGSGLLTTSRHTHSPLSHFASDVSGLQYQLPGAGIQGLLVDGPNIWVSIFDCGISLLRPVSAVTCLQLPSDGGAPQPRVNDVASDIEGQVWVAYQQSVARFDLSKGSFRNYEIENPNLLTIQTSRDGSVWCGGYNAGIFRLDPTTGRYSHLGSLDGRSVNSNVYDLFEDRQGRMWVGSQFDSLTCIEPDSRLPRYQIPGRGKMHQYPITRINDLGQLDEDLMAVATTDGVVLLDTRSGEQQTLMSEVDTCWKGTNYIACLDTDRARHIYIGTDGSGFVIYNVDTGCREHFTTHDGLPSNFIRSIECVGDSLLWVSTGNEGVFTFSLSRREVMHSLARSSELSSEGFHQDASAQLPDGSIVFGGREGAEVIRPRNLVSERGDVLFLISEVGLGPDSKINYLSHPEVLDAPVQQIDHLYMPYGETSLRIAFTAVDLYHNSDLRIVYRIDESNDFWQSLDEKRVATFYSLPPGIHTMTVRCMRGQQVVAQKILTIEAGQSPWLSWFAWLIYVALVLLLLFCILITIGKNIEHNAMQEKIRFFGSVAHDIRTPISLVTSPLSDLEQYISPEAPPSLLPLIKRNLKHLNDVVNQLSLFNKDQNCMQPKLEPVLLNEFVAGILEAYQSLATHRSLTLTASVPEEPVWVYADFKMLQRVFDNLLGNAFKFTREGGVTIEVRQQGERVCVEVIDTGIGMSEKARRRLFRHFFRGENAVKGRIPGFGLGMMYSYQAVQQMKGRLSCLSQEGKGSTFTLQLNVAPAGEEHSYDFSGHLEDVVEAAFRPVYSGYRHDILVVEDNAELLDYLKQKLSQGYNVLCANDVAGAKGILKSHHPDLIISDIMMPGMRGDDWCAELKQTIETSHIPIILLTANSDYQSQMHGLDMGADDYMTKPFDINLLLMKIRNLFEAKRKLHAHYMQLMQQPKPTPVTKDPVLISSSLDDQFVIRLYQVVERLIGQPDLNNERLASEMAMSHTLFYEKVNKVLGVPPASLIRQCRMKRARQLLSEGRLSVAEVAAQCGFTDSKYFSTAFKKFYGVSPKEVKIPS